MGDSFASLGGIVYGYSVADFGYARLLQIKKWIGEMRKMNIKQVFEVEGKQRWNIPGENGQAATLGAKLFVTDGQLLDSPDKVGKFPTTFNVDYAVFDEVKHVPGKYELELSLKVGSKGQMAVSGVRYVGTETPVK